MKMVCALLTIRHFVDRSSLGLSNFTLDDFEGALTHDTLDPRCTLLAEIHATMINIISSESIRVMGTLHATATSAALPIFANQEGADGMTAEEQELVARKALEYSRGWDRGAKLKSADGRDGWERHLIGLLCQRGGIETLPELPRILRHLLYGSSSPIQAEAAKAESEESDSGESLLDVDPEEQYLTLPIEDKLAIVGFLSELVLSSKYVRGYIEDCEAELTDLRKERIEINREKKALYVD
jgi:bromodomain adjacent to zinc finger domain protein 1A